MTQQTRPGGLTAMAVINFVYGGWKFLGLIAMGGLWAFKEKFIEMTRESGDEKGAAVMEAMFETGIGFWVLVLTMATVATILLIVSGVGYLKQKKVMGRALGNSFAVLEIAASVVALVMVPEAARTGGSLINSIGFIYPVLSLILLNLVFKEDFIR